MLPFILFTLALLLAKICRENADVFVGLFLLHICETQNTVCGYRQIALLRLSD
jgi:hypothetical protein